VQGIDTFYQSVLRLTISDKDWKQFVRFTLSFAFATIEELGFDNTCIFKEIDNKPVEMIMVGPKKYVIEGVIDDSRASSILGRATRIFIAKRVNSLDEPVGDQVVIKDAWVDESRDREHFIQAKILEDLGNQHNLKDHFFKHEAYADISTSDGQVDNTKRMTLDSNDKPLDFTKEMDEFYILPPSKVPNRVYNRTLQTIQSRSENTHISRAPSAGEERRVNANLRDSHDEGVVRRPFQVMPRIHYRLVMGELGTPLHGIIDLNRCVKLLGKLASGEGTLNECCKLRTYTTIQ
jgi:hypothetical protein